MTFVGGKYTMPHTHEWVEPRRVAKTMFTGILTVDELKQVSDEAIADMEEGQAPVHFITDLTALTQFPTNLLQVKDALVYISHPSMGWQVFFGAPALATSLIGIFGHIAHARMRAFRTYEQAIRFLKSEDATLTLEAPPRPTKRLKTPLAVYRAWRMSCPFASYLAISRVSNRILSLCPKSSS